MPSPKKKALKNISSKNTGEYLPSDPMDLLRMGGQGALDAYSGIADATTGLGKEYATDPIVEQMSLEQAIPASMPEARQRQLDLESGVSDVAAGALFDPLNAIPGAALAGKTGKAIKAARKLPARFAEKGDEVRWMLYDLANKEAKRKQAKMYSELSDEAKAAVDSVSPSLASEPMQAERLKSIMRVEEGARDKGKKILESSDLGSGKALDSKALQALQKKLDKENIKLISDDTVPIIKLKKAN
jgi:hypothetical protein